MAAPTGSDLLSGIRPTVDRLPTSAIRQVSDYGMAMAGADIIPLWFGEPDSPTPQFIIDAATQAMHDGHLFYADNRGVPPLREALARYMSRVYGRDIAVDRISVTASGMNALMLVQEMLIEPGDNVAVVVPLWPNLVETVHIMGGETRLVELSEAGGRWTLDLDALFAACDDRTKAIMINSPNNPTGWMMEADQQRAVLDFARERGLWVVADDVYARIVYDRPHAPSFIELAEPEDRVITVNSFSKSWSMTGWRLGWITAPAALEPVLAKLTEYNIAGPTTFVQYAGVTAIDQGEPFIAETVERYRQNRDLVHQRLAAMDRVKLARPDAAFYAFFAVDGAADSLDLAKTLVREAGVGLAPGCCFGPSGEGHLRLCFAAGHDALSRALDRLEAHL